MKVLLSFGYVGQGFISDKLLRLPCPIDVKYVVYSVFVVSFVQIHV